MIEFGKLVLSVIGTRVAQTWLQQTWPQQIQTAPFSTTVLSLMG